MAALQPPPALLRCTALHIQGQHCQCPTGALFSNPPKACLPYCPPAARSMCHAILDGMRWPGLATHLAARYRQAAGGPAADPNELLHPIDRSVLSLERYLR